MRTWHGIAIMIAFVLSYASRENDPAFSYSRSDASPSYPRAAEFTARGRSSHRLPRGVDKDCRDFKSQAEAQAFFEANDPDEDPHHLDGDGDGIACERLR